MSALAIPPLVAAYCADHAFGAIVADEALSGGIICATRRLTTASGASLVVKQDRGCAHDFFRLEARGLRAIAMGDGWRVPEVLASDHECLVLEDLGPGDVRADDFSERLGRAWARLHGRIGGRFGWDADNYYGRYRMDNRWRDDGCAFYAETRFLPWLRRPRCAALFDERDRRDCERLCARFAEIMPRQSPALLHGDLWFGNLLADRDGAPAVVDPSPHYGWPEEDLHNAQMFGGFDQRFWDAYRECHPLDPGWRERLEIFYLPHLMGMIEHDCDVTDSLAWARAILRRYA